MKKRALVVVSFGTTHEDTMEKTIKAVEKKLEMSNPDRDIYRTFTSRIVIKRLADNKGIIVQNELQILEYLADNQYEEVLVQPLHIIPGFEYEKIKEACDKYRDKFDCIKLSEPLLFKEEDFVNVSDVLIEEMKNHEVNYDAVVFMGHGTGHDSNSSYLRLQKYFEQTEQKVLFGTVEGYPGIEDIIKSLKVNNSRNILLLPFMLVAGDHVKNDMMGNNENSWVSLLRNQGYKVTPFPKGLGEYLGIQDLFVRKAEL